MTPVKIGNGKESEHEDYHVRPQTEPWLPGSLPDIPDVGSTMPLKMTEDQKVSALMAGALERMIVRLDTPQPTPPGGNRWWLGPGLTLAGLAIGAFGIQYVPRAQAGNEKELSIITYRLEQAEKAAQEKNKEIRLMENYNRDLYIWFSERGLKGVPPPPKLKED